MNRGGFSWKRLVGVSALKSRLSRKIGIPLTASGRRRKLGAFIFNAVGYVVGTIAVATSEATKREKSLETKPQSRPRKSRSVYFCQVKGITHSNDDGTSRSDAIKKCSVGDPVRLVPDPQNQYDKHAIRVMIKTGEQIGYISARQAGRLVSEVPFLKATICSRIKDDWGNDTVKLRVVDTAHAHEEKSERKSAISSIREGATKIEMDEGWQSTLIYFEDASRGLYRIVPVDDVEDMRQSLQGGMAQIGFIGLKDAPKGIRFGFVLKEGLPTNGSLAQRFLANAREWVVTESQGYCAKRGLPAPVVHDFEPSKEFLNPENQEIRRKVESPNNRAFPLALAGLLCAAEILIGLWIGHWFVFGILFVLVFAKYYISS